MLKKLLLAAAAIAATTSLAGAADLVTKAVPSLASSYSSPCTPTSCSGFYIGGGIGGVGTNANVIGNGINVSIFAGGGSPFADIGYQYAVGNWFFGGELGAGDQVSTTASLAGAAVGNENGFFAYQIAKVGGNLNSLFGSQQPISIPPQLANALISPYVLVGSAEHQFGKNWATGWASGAGATFDVSSHWFIDLKYMNVQYNSANSGGVSFSNENIIMTSFNYKF